MLPLVELLSEISSVDCKRLWKLQHPVTLVFLRIYYLFHTTKSLFIFKDSLRTWPRYSVKLTRYPPRHSVAVVEAARAKVRVHVVGVYYGVLVSERHWQCNTMHISCRHTFVRVL